VKNIRHLCTALLLMLVLAFSTMAGEMQGPGITSEPPTPGTSSGEIQFPGVTAAGEMQGPGIAETASATEFAMSLVYSVMSVL
jgi:hypothetical protein